ncbi:hypothetical protein [Stetteria hydrogenophila]
MEEGGVERVVRDLLSRRDPHGYYVIPAKAEAEEVVRQLGVPGVLLEPAGDTVYVKVRSRSGAARIARRLAKLGLLALEEEGEE